MCHYPFYYISISSLERLGASILLFTFYARLLAVCDTFDAITSRRVYREQATIKEALQEIERVKGTQLDATLIDKFTDMVNSKMSKIEKIITI